MALSYVITDIDGTLTDASGALDVDALEAIRALRAYGYEVILASARSAWEAWTISKLVGASPPVIAENGGVIVFSPLKMVLLGDKLAALRGLEALERRGLEVRIKQTVPPLTSVILEPGPSAKELREVLQEEEPDVDVVETGFSLILAKKGVNKAEALRALGSFRPELKPEEAIAVGDGDNDVPLFDICGYSIAPSNATPEAKRAARYVAKGAYGKGLHEGMERLLRLGLLKYRGPAKG